MISNQFIKQCLVNYEYLKIKHEKDKIKIGCSYN